MDAATAPTGTAQAPAQNGAANTNGAAGLQTPANGPPPEGGPVRPTPKKKAEPTGKQEALGRGPDGKFLTKQGKEAPAEEKPAEAYRFRRKLKIDGVEEDADLSEDDIQREVQIARAARKRLSELNTKTKELEAWEKRLKEAPHEFLEKAGHDPDKWAAERLAKKAQEGLMSEEERAYRAKEAEASELRAKVERYEQQEQEREMKAHEDKLWAQEEPRYLQAMEAANLPRGSHVMSVLADVGMEFLDAKIPLAPEQVVAEVSARLDASASRYVLSLPTPALAKKLGPRLNDLVKHHLEEFRSRQAAFSDEPAPPRAQPEEPPARRETISSAEVDRRLRELTQGLR